MKPFLFTLLFSALIASEFKAQTFDYEELTIKYEVKALTPFTTDFKTISVRFHGEGHLKRYGILPSELLGEEYKFIKYANVESGGDLHLDVYVDQPEYMGVEQQKSTRKENEKDVTIFYYQGSVITPIRYELRDGARELIKEEIVYDAGDHLHFYSDSQPTSYALSKAWEESKNIVISKNMTTILRNSLKQTAMKVRDRFDDQVMENKFTVFSIKKGDKINAEYISTAFEKLKSRLAQNPVITSWDEATRNEVVSLLQKGTKLSYDDKDARVGYAVAHYDLALLNMLWGNLDAARTHIQQGKKADRKNWEFDQLAAKINDHDGREKPDELSSKAYVSTYQQNADTKLPALLTGETTGGVGESLSPFHMRSIDTITLTNGEKLIGFVKAVHKYRTLPEGEIHDLTHFLVNPVGDTEKEIEVKVDDVQLLLHKGTPMRPMQTQVPVIQSPMHLYEALSVSSDQRLGLLRTAYHESMPKNYSANDMRVLQLSFKAPGAEEFETLPISTGLKYSLGINGGLAKDFESCPAIVAKAKEKKYELSEDSMKELVEDYNSCVKK